MRRIHLLAVFGVALVAALALILINLGPTVAQAAPPDRGPWPYQEYKYCDAGTGAGQHCEVQLAPVPPGRRLIIQHVSVEAMVATGVQPRMTLFAKWNGQDVLYFLPAQKVVSFTGQDYLRGTHEVLAFADSTGPSKVYLNRYEAGSALLNVTVSGYLEAL